ncbi:MAG TPA: pyridoxamine 5'-phosphate oxidase family protein [Thermomicrobiaceae bacterium]|nr:pyridoxamine 5'-phosphate oxidase family protein [Thermomicrobiaceae bacterium]
MTDRTPARTTNLDRYGSRALPWSRAHDELAKGSSGSDITHFLGTVSPDCQPHVAGVGAAWIDGDLYFTSNLAARKARNLAANPACTIAVKLAGIDLTLQGTAEQVSDVATLERVAEIYRDGGWPSEVAGDALTAPYSAPSAGPPPWHVFRFTFHTVVGVATAEPFGATRWQFGR